MGCFASANSLGISDVCVCALSRLTYEYFDYLQTEVLRNRIHVSLWNSQRNWNFEFFVKLGHIFERSLQEMFHVKSRSLIVTYTKMGSRDNVDGILKAFYR